MGARKLDRDAGKCVAELCPVKHATAGGRVVNDNAPATDLGYDDEMVELPVEHRGRLQLAKVRDAEPQRAADESERVRDSQHRAKVGPHVTETAAHGCQVEIVAEVVRNHREGGQAAFARARLQDQRHPHDQDRAGSPETERTSHR